MNLNDIIAEWDGKSVSAITRIYETHKDASDFGHDLVACLGTPHSERGVTWLLKHHLEKGWSRQGGPTSNEREAMIKALPTFLHWEARLHALQCLDHLEIPHAAAEPLATYLKNAITDEAKFVRAWAYHGWYVLADQYPSYRPQALALLEAGQRTESAASVKVRIRKALQNIGAR